MDEKKEYSVVGTVTIGTDEYRDLLTGKFEAEKDMQEYRSKWSNLYLENSQLEKQNKELIKELNQLREYIKENNEQDKLELWIVRSSRRED